MFYTRKHNVCICTSKHCSVTNDFLFALVSNLNIFMQYYQLIQYHYNPLNVPHFVMGFTVC